MDLPDLKEVNETTLPDKPLKAPKEYDDEERQAQAIRDERLCRRIGAEIAAEFRHRGIEAERDVQALVLEKVAALVQKQHSELLQMLEKMNARLTKLDQRQHDDGMEIKSRLPKGSKLTQ